MLQHLFHEVESVTQSVKQRTCMCKELSWPRNRVQSVVVASACRLGQQLLPQKQRPMCRLYKAPRCEFSCLTHLMPASGYLLCGLSHWVWQTADDHGIMMNHVFWVTSFSQHDGSTRTHLERLSVRMVGIESTVPARLTLLSVLQHIQTDT